MVEVRQTETFDRCFASCATGGQGARIQIRIDRLVLGLPGDVRPVGEGVSELRVDDGPGYRVYFAQRGETLIVLLAGGDKGSQDRDISTALVLARSL